MSSESSRAYGATRYNNFVLVFILLILIAVLVLSLASPTHAPIIAHVGVLLVAAMVGLLLGLHSNHSLSSVDIDEASIPSFLKPRAMLIGFSVLLPLVALGAGIAAYSGSHKMIDLTSGLRDMVTLTAVELIFIFVGQVTKRRRH